MKWALIPQPRKRRFGPQTFAVPRSGIIGLSDWELWPAAQEARAVIGDWPAAIAKPEKRDALMLERADLPAEAYRLKIDRQGIRVAARDATGIRNGLRTLKQIVRQAKGKLPSTDIEDAPALADRGLYYDVTRGRVPRRSSLVSMASRLADFKINQFQLYIEHTYHFRSHPLIGRGTDPLTADDMLALDNHCAGLGIDFVPSFASLGHLPRILTLEPYRHLAEDYGVGRLQTDADCVNQRIGWSLAVDNPDIYSFLEELYADFLPCFRSRRFNATCDEAYDLGCGQSYNLARKIGRGRLLLRHVLKLREQAARHGKHLQIWADLVRKYPEIVTDLPEDVELLDWGYHSRIDFDRIADFAGAGHRCQVCPSVNGYRTLFPVLHESAANIAGWADAARRHGAQGLLNTDWGDKGHQNFNELSWYGYLFAAEQAWNPDADRSSFSERFCRVFLNSDDPDCAAAVDELGDIAQVQPLDIGAPVAVWLPLFFACPGKRPGVFSIPPSYGTTRRYQPLKLDGVVPTNRAQNGKIRYAQPMKIDAGLGAETMERLRDIGKRLAAVDRRRAGDPDNVLPYWLFAVDTLKHAARKLTVLGTGGTDTAARRRSLAREMQDLQQRFEELWLARNRRSEIEMTLKKYRQAVKSLHPGG